MQKSAAFDRLEHTMGFLTGKRLLITGLLSNRSIAYGIARACHREGAELAFSYVGDRFKERTGTLAADFGSTLLYDCDVADDAQIERLFNQSGRNSTVSSIRSVSPRVNRSQATSSTVCHANRSASRTTFPPTASRRWPRRRCPGCGQARHC